jgi:hypothetical protein
VISILLTEDEVASFNVHSYYPKCFNDPGAFSSAFIWGSTRQGRGYWASKWQGDWVFNGDSKNTVINLTPDDKTYITLLYFANVNRVNKFIISDKASKVLYP